MRAIDLVRCHGRRLLQVQSLFASLAVVFMFGGDALGQENASACGSLDNGNNGPFDYAVERGRKLTTVEEFHFTPSVERLIRGQSGSLGDDLNYTLMAFPNHHRALMSKMALGEKVKSPQPPGAHFPVECYFERALRFRRSDTIVKMIYATFLSKKGRLPEAIQQLELATASAGDNPFTHNNIGLVYFDLKDYDKALQQAHRAIALGFTQNILRDQLQKIGKWSEPPANTSSAASSVNSSTDQATPASETPASKASSK